MARERECPKCGEPMELHDYDPDCGIEGGWSCANESCGYGEPYESDDDWDYA